ncbi:MAG: hypothetical protein ACQGVC_07760 [Myxococcota bacterium]
MLVCRACNTRYEEGRAVCPSCGRRSSRNATESGGSDSGPLPPSEPLDAGTGEIDLGEDSVVAAEASAKAEAPARPKPAASAAPQSDVAATPDQVKTLLAEQPGLLETGLGLHADDDGDPMGIDFPTPVGSIDLLARDRKGGFVVVHLPAPDEVADSVSAMLRRMGWVRKHLADDGEDVRGVVVLDQLPEELVYAAAGAGGAISFKSCRLSLSFHDLDA